MRHFGFPFDFSLCQFHDGTAFGVWSVYKLDSTWGNQGRLHLNPVIKAEIMPTNIERKAIQVCLGPQMRRVCIDDETGPIFINIRLVPGVGGSLFLRVGEARGIFLRVCSRLNIDVFLRLRCFVVV